MAFPDTPRVVYETNTLEEVKCQIRFPPILAIEANPPASFQEAVRAEFPFFSINTSVKLPVGVPSGIAKIVERDLSLVGEKSYSFTSEDRIWTLSLSKEGLTLACRRYERWEPFREHLRRALDSLVNLYRPSFFLHTCVRYKNSVRPKALGLDGVAWSALLQPWISGLLDKSETADGVEALQNRCVIRLQEIKVEAAFSLGRHQPSNEQAFIIEAHVFNDSRKVQNDVLPRLDTLHRQASLFFRWCITDELHRAMRPRPV
jgi:uncharacterized protein (TIGR04255 family)